MLDSRSYSEMMEYLINLDGDTAPIPVCTFYNNSVNIGGSIQMYTFDISVILQNISLIM